MRIRAVDKAGNIREGEFDPSVVPERKATASEGLISVAFMVLLLLGGVLALYLDQRVKRGRQPTA